MIPSYVQKILDWPVPTTGKQLKQFLWFIGYYRGFIPDIADLTFEMNSMKAHTRLEWTESTLQKVWTLKQRFGLHQPRAFYPLHGLLSYKLSRGSVTAARRG